MPDMNSIVSEIGSGVGNTMVMVLWMMLALFIITAIGLTIFLIYWYKRRWNILVEFKIPRSDGKFISAEWGRGFYNAKKGICYIKRKGIMNKKVPMKTFDVKKFLQGTKLLTVIQVTPIHYLPVYPKSYTKLINEKTKQEIGILDLVSDFSEDKAWKEVTERNLKGAYSIQNILAQYQVPLAIGIVALMIFVGFAIIWGRLPSVCG